MLDFALKLVDSFSAPLQNDYVTPWPTLGFGLTGPEYVGWDGHTAVRPGPFLLLVPAGVRLRDKWVGHRRNWAALLETRDVRAAGDDVEVRSCGQWIAIPWWVPVDPALVGALEMEWEQIRSAHRDGLPGAALQARIGVAGILSRFLDRGTSRAAADPAARLKQRIDEDRKHLTDLDTLSRECGYSPDHMRLLFRQAYGINPQRYRNTRRLATAMHLLAGSTLSVKQVCAQTGFRHTSHLTALFSKEFGMTPSAALRRYRHGR